MLTQFGSVASFKAYRSPREVDRLDFARLRSNMQEGIETQLMLDANILIDMQACCAPELAADDTTLSKFQLLEWVTFLRTCNGLGLSYFLSPFFALQELPVDKVADAARAINEFPRKFGLSWIDDNGALSPELAEVGRRVSRARYEGMRDPERRVFALNYSALLLMLVVARDSTHCDPFVRFARYLRLYQRRINAVSMRALCIARLTFGPQPPEGSEFYSAWERVVRNFTDRKSVSKRLPRSLHEMDSAALNGAYDLMLLDAALIVEAKGIDDVPVDPWIVSKDKKLASMGEIIRHAGPEKAEAGQLLEMVPFEEYGDYWARTAQVLNSVGLRARRNMQIDWHALECRALGVVAFAASGLGGLVNEIWYQNSTTLRCGKGDSRESPDPEAPLPTLYRAE